MKKNDKRVLFVSGVLLLVFLLIALLVPFVHSGAYWVCLCFGVVAVALQYPFYKLAFKAGADARSKFYGFPIERIGLCYLLGQLVLSLLGMALAQWAPAWIPALLSALLLAAASIGYVAADAMREEVERQDVQLKADVTAMRALQSKAAALSGQCENADAAKALQALAESFRFSDPVTSPATAEAEGELAACLDELQKAVVDGDSGSTASLCQRAQALLRERNRLCKLGK